MNLQFRCLSALRALVASAEIVASKLPASSPEAAQLREDAELGHDVLDRYNGTCELDTAIFGAITQPF